MREKDRLINMRSARLALSSYLSPCHFLLSFSLSCWHFARYFWDRQTGSSQRQVPLLPLSVSLYICLSLSLAQSLSLSSDCLPQGLPLVKLPDCTINARVCWERPEMRTDSSREG